MCLYLKSSDYKTEKKTATEDIVCYKIINGSVRHQGGGFYHNYARREIVGYKNSALPISKNMDENLPQYILDNPDCATFFHTPFQTTPIEFGERFVDNVPLDGCNCNYGFYRYYGEEPLSEEDEKFMKEKLWWFDREEDIFDYRVAHSLIASGVFHSVATFEDAMGLLSNDDYYLDNGDFVGIAKCIIPKGAEYYEGVFESTGIRSYGSKEIIYESIEFLADC